MKIANLYENLPEIFTTILYNCEENNSSYQIIILFFMRLMTSQIRKRTGFDFNVSCFKKDRHF